MPVHSPSNVSALPLHAYSPPASAASSRRPGAIIPGSNGSLWIAQPKKTTAAVEADTGASSSQGSAAATAAPVQQQAMQWALYLVAGQQESLYWVHDNGGRPFMVRVTPQIFAVYKVPSRTTSSWYPSKELMDEQQAQGEAMQAEDRSDEYVVDPDLIIPDNEYSHPRLFMELVAGCDSYLRLWAGEDESVSYEFGLGNSLLVQLSDLQYMFIGWAIETFEVETGETIEEYKSPIGNNDVPYPYAVGTKNTYLTTERVYIPNVLRLLEDEDPYQQYYESPSRTTDWQYDMTTTIVCSRQW